MSSPQTKVTADSAEALSNTAKGDAGNNSTEAATVSKQVVETDLNISADNGETSVSVDGIEVKASEQDKNISDAVVTEHEYRVGDPVWAKIKSHPWWPGQIHDPKNASEFAVKQGQEGGRLLVAFFGDGSWSWCSPTQLMPFVDNFNQMSNNSTSKRVANAVNKALEEVSRIVDSNMRCGCGSSELSRLVVENAGIKAGVFAPEVDVRRLLLREYEASEVLSKLADYAKNATFHSALDFGVVRGWLSAFHRSKGCDELQVYQEPFYIEGLEDDSSESDEGKRPITSDAIRAPVEVPVVPGPGPGPEDSDGPPLPNSGALVVRHPRRRKSVNDIMAESESVPPKRHRRGSVEDVTDVDNSETGTKMTVGEKDGEGSSGKENDKGEVKDSSASAKTAEEMCLDVAGTSNGVGLKDGKSKRKSKTEEAVDNAEETGSEEAKDEGDTDVIISTPRERKKSKYLSYPYTEPTWRVGSSSFKKGSDTMKNAKADGEGEQMITKSAEDRSVDQAKEADSDADMNIKLSSLRLNVDLPVKKVPSAKPSKGHFLKKAKSQEQEIPKAVNAKGQTESSSKAEKSVEIEKSEKSKSKKSAESSQAATPNAGKAAEEKASLVLVLTFTSGFPLPSKEDILNAYSKFGRLSKRETNVFEGSHSAQIVFKKATDAEAAFKSSVSENPFGMKSVETHWLKYGSSSHGPHIPEIPMSEKKPELEHPETSGKAADSALSEMNLIRKKLEITDAILGAYHAKFTEADKTTLKEEFQNLKERVEAACERVHELAERAALSNERDE